MNLIISGDSTIGHALSNYWSDRKIPFHASSRSMVNASEKGPLIDLAEKDTFRNLNDYQSAVLCAGVSNMLSCENNPSKTRFINVTGTITLMTKLTKKGTHIVFLSTNAVLDGKYPNQKPDTTRNPINEYGKQKAEVEVFIDNLSNACILRLAKVIHPGLTLFKKWEQSLSNGQPIFAFKDMTLSPVNIDDVIKKIDTLVKQKATGIYQLSGARDITYYEFAQDFAEMNGYSRNLVTKDTWEGKLGSEPPKYTSMLNV